MKQQITIDGVTLTRAQVEQAYKALQEPEVPEVDRSQPVTDRITVFDKGAIQVPRHMVEEALSFGRQPYVWISTSGLVTTASHNYNDHDLPTLTGFTSAPQETR